LQFSRQSVPDPRPCGGKAPVRGSSPEAYDDFCQLRSRTAAQLVGIEGRHAPSAASAVLAAATAGEVSDRRRDLSLLSVETLEFQNDHLRTEIDALKSQLAIHKSQIDRFEAKMVRIEKQSGNWITTTFQQDAAGDSGVSSLMSRRVATMMDTGGRNRTTAVPAHRSAATGTQSPD